MHATPTGLLIVPLSLAVFLLAPGRLGQWAIVVSALDAASVVNVGGGFPVGITPYFFVASLIAARVGARALNGRIGFRGGEPVRDHVRALSLFVLWAAASAFLLPVIFKGLPVDLERAGVDQTYLYRVPLHWTFSNAGQAGYLLLDLCVVLLFVGNAARPGYIAGLMRAFTWCGLIVVAVGAYQLLSYRFGFPFPKSFFYSNTAWAQLAGEGIAGRAKINSTFPEASAAGNFLAMWTVFELVLAARTGREGARHWWLALAGTFMVINTTSTTGYVALAIAWTYFTWRYLVRFLWQGRVAVRAVLAAALCVGASAAALLIGGHGRSLLDAVIFDKMQSGSAVHRLASIYRSGGIFADSFGLGVGLGSDRPLSSGAYIVADLGAVGVVLFSYLLWQLYAMGASSARPVHSDRQGRVWLEVAGWALSVQLVAMLVSGAEITGPTLWIPWAILAAVIRRNWLASAKPVPVAAEHVLLPARISAGT